MRRLLAVALLAAALPALAAESREGKKKESKDADLGKKEASAAPDKSLAGDLTRKKEDKGQAAPAMQYDQFVEGIKMQVREKRLEQIESLQKIIGLTPADSPEMPDLRFRMGELYWEESKWFFFEANKKDDDLIRCLNAKNKACQEKAKREKEELLGSSKKFSQMATDEYTVIAKRYKDYKRTDEVLYFLGHNLMEQGEERKALVAYGRLIEKYPKSKYLPDAYLAYGEYYFNNSKGKKDELAKALEQYKKAASYADSPVYAFALYKQGWCYFNLGDYNQALAIFKAVVMYGELSGTAAIEKDGGKSGKGTLMREARNDFVRTYSRIGSPTDARAEFAKVASKDEDRFIMLKQLANLYYEDGKDREAALTYNTLIKWKPLSPEAPGFQGKIVDCVLRAGNKKMTVEQVRRLVQIMNDVAKSGAIKEEKDKKAIEEARELSERTISNLAVNWHNEAKKTRDEETFKYANEVYSDYLILFPDNPKAYDLRFFWAELLNDNLLLYEKAAEQYTLVLMQDVRKIEGEKQPDGSVKKGKPGKFMARAAHNAILAYNEVVKKAEESGKVPTAAGGDPSKPAPIPPVKQSLLDACERYLKYVPKGDKGVEVKYQAAIILYRFNHFFDEKDKDGKVSAGAITLLTSIAMNHPDYKTENGDRIAEVAANLVLDSYNLLKDYAGLNKAAREFYANEKLATGPFRDELARQIEQSAFKLINQLEANKEFAAAAEKNLEFVNEFPKSALADGALYNASVDFYNAKMVDKAIEARGRVIKEYPKSKHVPACVFANAEAREAITDFSGAAQDYEAYVGGFERSSGKGKKGARGREAADAPAQSWEEPKAQNALINAGIFRDGLGEYKQALKDRERFLDLWPKTKEAEAVTLSIIDLHERNGAYSKAIKGLEDYARDYGSKDPGKRLVAIGRVAAIYTKMQRGRDAKKAHEHVLAEYKKLGPNGRKNLDNAALDAAAKAHFEGNDEEFRKFSSMKLRWTNIRNPGEFKKSVQDKAKALEGVQKAYTETVNLKSANPAICALYKIGLAYDNFSESLINAPMPRQMPPELADEFRIQLEQQAQPVKAKAAEAFVAAVNKSRELDVYNDCSHGSLKMLREKYSPGQFPSMDEERLELKVARAQSVGEDVLLAVQPIPVVTPKQVERQKAEVKKLEKEVVELEEKIDEPPPKKAPPSKEPQGDPKKASGKETTREGDDEPEEVL